MTSLVLSRWRPDAVSNGAALRNAQNIRSLALFGPVDVLSIGVDDAAQRIAGVREWQPFPLEPRGKWRALTRKAWPLRPGVHPALRELEVDAARRWLDRRADECRYDVALVEGIALAGYMRLLRRLARTVVFDMHNIEAALHADVVAASPMRAGLGRRAKDAVLHRRLERAERRAIAAADVLWVCSARDADLARQLYVTPSRTAVVPNGVDVDRYRRPGVLAAGHDWSAFPITIVYPGLFSYSPNEDAALRLIHEVLPAIRGRGLAVRLVLVGRNPTAAMTEAAARWPDIEVTGAVESVLPYLEQPCVVALPIALGGGTRLKIVEAFAVGRPVVSTAKGAEGLDCVDGEHLLLREHSSAIADAVVELWGRPDLRHALCTRALALVRACYCWTVAAKAIAESLDLAAPRPPAEASYDVGHERTRPQPV